MSITDYPSLIAAAKQQPQPQRLLFVFLKAELPKDHSETEAANFNAGRGGELEPMMCADKTLDELGSFADLVAESERVGKSWDIVLVAALSGKNGVPPTSDDASKPLEVMINAVKQGAYLSSYLAFDKKGDPIQFG